FRVPGGSGPSGTVEFYDGPTRIATAGLSQNGLYTASASLEITKSPLNLIAVYSGDANFALSRSGDPTSTGAVPVSISVSSSSNPSIFGDPVTLKVAVLSALSSKRPSGTVAISILGLFGLGVATLDSSGS